MGFQLGPITVILFSNGIGKIVMVKILVGWMAVLCRHRDLFQGLARSLQTRLFWSAQTQLKTFRGSSQDKCFEGTSNYLVFFSFNGEFFWLCFSVLAVCPFSELALTPQDLIVASWMLFENQLLPWLYLSSAQGTRSLRSPSTKLDIKKERWIYRSLKAVPI